MKNKIIKSITAVLSLTCLCASFGGCKVKDTIDGWFNKDKAESSVADLPLQSSVEDVPLHEHSYDVRYRVEPDCYTQGVKIYECSCGDVYMKKTPTYHIWVGDEYSFMCDICEETPSEWWVSEVYPLIEAGEVTEEEVESGDVWVRYYEG